MQIIGTRPHSLFRVPADYFAQKPHMQPGIDPTTGGPCAVVEDFTDTPVKDAVIDTDPRSQSYRSVITVKPKPKPKPAPAVVEEE